MTVTTEIPYVDDMSTESVTIKATDKTDFVLVSSDIDVKTKRSTAIYTLTGADPGYPVTLTVNCEPPLSGRNRYCSFSLKTWIKQSSSVTDEVKYRPLQGNIAFVIDGDSPITAVMLDDLLSTVYSLTAKMVTTGVRDTSELAKLLAGSPQII
jgi:hypothetical protein